VELIGGGEPPFVGVDLGNNDEHGVGRHLRRALTSGHVRRADESANPNETQYNDAWVPMKTVREEIKVKGEDKPRSCRAEVLEARSGVL
jgi:acyl-homoserine lactone acylase PvdQ